MIVAAPVRAEADRLTFEVASIKPSATPGITRMRGGPGTNEPGQFGATNAALSVLLMRAYGIQYDQLSGPPWIHTTEFDVVANVAAGATAEQLRIMLQNLLADRFRIQAHHETRVMQVYELTVAEHGPRLKPAAKGSETDDFVAGSAPRRRTDRDDFPVLPPGRPNVACAHLPNGVRCTYRMTTMALLTGQMRQPNFLDRLVIDKTGLNGQYDFTLYFTPTTGAPTPPDDAGPSIEQALKQQLGLKLSPSKVSLDILVLDHVERTPTDN